MATGTTIMSTHLKILKNFEGLRSDSRRISALSQVQPTNMAMSNPPIGSMTLEARKSALSRKLRPPINVSLPSGELPPALSAEGMPIMKIIVPSRTVVNLRDKLNLRIKKALQTSNNDMAED